VRGQIAEGKVPGSATACAQRFFNPCNPTSDLSSLASRLCIDSLRRAHRGSKLDFGRRGFGDYMFEGSEHSHRVQIVVVADVSDAEKLPLHFRLSVGHDRAK